MSLASFTLAEVSKEQFEKLQNVFTTEFHGGGNHTETSGTFIDHAATVDYKYDVDKSELTLSVEKINRVLFKKPSTNEVEENLRNLVEEVLGEMPPDKTEESVEQTEPVVETEPTTETTFQTTQSVESVVSSDQSSTQDNNPEKPKKVTLP